jgi:hypothetical protein
MIELRDSLTDIWMCQTLRRLRVFDHVKGTRKGRGYKTIQDTVMAI